MTALATLETASARAHLRARRRPRGRAAKPCRVWGKRLPLRKVVSSATLTGHDHVDAVGLIHMNGRAYDPELGRFLGVDPFITKPLNSQSLNPYSYVMNNPIMGVDPTGYADCSVDDKNCTPEPEKTPEEEKKPERDKREPMTGSRIKGVDTGASCSGNCKNFGGGMMSNGAQSKESKGDKNKSANDIQAQQDPSTSGFGGQCVGPTCRSSMDISPYMTEPENQIDFSATSGGTAEDFLASEGLLAGRLICTERCFASANNAHVGAANRYLGASLATDREVSWRVYQLEDGTYSYTFARVGDVGSAFVSLPTRLSGYTFDSAGHTHWDSNHKFSPQDWRLITQDQRNGYGIKLYVATGGGGLQYSTPDAARKLGVTRGASYNPPLNNFAGTDLGVNIRTDWP